VLGQVEVFVLLVSPHFAGCGEFGTPNDSIGTPKDAVQNTKNAILGSFASYRRHGGGARGRIDGVPMCRRHVILMGTSFSSQGHHQSLSNLGRKFWLHFYITSNYGPHGS
jgi:hypothetical protein